MASRNATNARDELFDLLKQDHKHVRKHFREFEKLDPAEDFETCEQLVARVCDELEVHASIEEELFYPAARTALAGKEGEDLVDEAEVEHASLKMLIGELRALSPEDAKFKAHFTVLSEYVKHHVKEEEGEMFEKLARASIDWEALLQQMLDREQQLKAEKGLDEAGEPDVAAAADGARRHGNGGARAAKR